MNLSSVIYYCAVLALSAWMTWWAWKLWKQYRLDFLRDFFIFILTFHVYGFLNFTGQVFLIRMYPDGGFEKILGNIIVFTLAVPVLAAWIYFFILWLMRICSIELRKKSKIIYWVINAALILTNFYAIHVLIDTRDQYATKAILFWKIPFYVCLFLGVCAVALIRSRRLKIEYRKHFIRRLSLAYITGFVIMIIFGDISSMPDYLGPFLYLTFLSIIYFSINLLPAWYISSALKSHLNELSSLKSNEIDPSGETTKNEMFEQEDD